MPKNAKDAKNSDRRTRVTDLPKKEKELTAEEQRKVKGGGFEPQPLAAEAQRR
ncbi:MAG TPA: hypothetical protein VGB73_19370 [Pyrinomonadaceae bacterium]|jgi:hypothetical protein